MGHGGVGWVGKSSGLGTGKTNFTILPEARPPANRAYTDRSSLAQTLTPLRDSQTWKDKLTLPSHRAV